MKNELFEDKQTPANLVALAFLVLFVFWFSLIPFNHSNRLGISGRVYIGNEMRPNLSNPPKVGTFRT